MVKIRFSKIVWDGFNREHIKKHGGSVEEVEAIIKSDVTIIEGHSGRKILIRKVGTRILSVVVSMKINKVYPVTARDAKKEERQNYYEYEKNKKS